MAIVRIGGRRPTDQEIQGAVAGDIGLDWVESFGVEALPIPVPKRGSLLVAVWADLRPRRHRRPGLHCLVAKYLCDGGDRADPGRPNAERPDHGRRPRDAIVRFDIGVVGASKARILPTNVVCVYRRGSPRFASAAARTRTSISRRPGPIKRSPSSRVLNQKSTPAAWCRTRPPSWPERARAAGLKGRLMESESSNARAASAYAANTLAVLNTAKQTAELSRNRQKLGQVNKRLRLDGIKSAEGPVITGITEGASEAVKVWGPHSMTGVEEPPDRPGLAVIKRVSAIEAEPGDTLTYAIVYRNMGNTPIRSVSIVDSLLPRLEYKPGSSSGPEGTRFTTAPNRVARHRASLGASRHARARRHGLCVVPGNRALSLRETSTENEFSGDRIDRLLWSLLNNCQINGKVKACLRCGST